MKKTLFIFLSCFFAISLVAQIKVIKNEEQERTLDMSFKEGKSVNMIDMINLEPVMVEEKGDYSPNNKRALRALYNRPEGTYIHTIGGLADPEFFNKYYPSYQFWLGAGFSIPWKFRNHSTDAQTYLWSWPDEDELNSTEFEPEFFNFENADGRRFMIHSNPWYKLPTLRATASGSHSYYTPKIEREGGFAGIQASTGPLEVSNVDLYENTADVGIMTTTRNGGGGLDGTGDGAWFGPCRQAQHATNHPEVPVGSKNSHIISFYEKPQSPMIVKMVTVMVRNLNDDLQVVANDIELKMTAYKAHKEWVVEMDPENPGTIYYEGYRWKLDIDENDEIISEKYGEATITGNDLHRMPSSTNPNIIIAGMPFKFTEIDDWGREKAVYLLVDEAFALVIEGVDQVGQNWNIFCDQGNEFDQTAWVLMKDPNGRLIRRGAYDGAGAGTVKYISTWLSVRNTTVLLNAHFPFIYTDPGYDVLTIPEEGGKAVDKDEDEGAVFLSEFSFMEQGLEMVWIDNETVPEWITYTKSSLPFFNNYEWPNWLTFDFIGQPLPSGVAGRQANIKIRTYGNTYVEGEYVTIKIIQGNPTYTVTFNIIDGGGAPVEGATIEFDGTVLDGYTVQVPNGNYDYTVTKEGYEVETGSVEVNGADKIVTVELKVGINSKFIPNFVLTPNPFTNEISISNTAFVKSVQIMNLAGQTVKGISLSGKSIFTGELSSGVYFVVIENITGEKSVHKMVKK